MTVELENLVDAYQDLMGAAEEGEGFTLEDIRMRYELLDIDFDDYRQFMMSRLAGLDEYLDVHPEWARGFVYAAMEFFLYGHLTGKEAALDMEIDLNGD